MLLLNNDQQKKLKLSDNEQKILNHFFKRKSGHKDFKLIDGCLGETSNFYNVIDDDFELCHGYLNETNNGDIVYNTNETDVPYIYYLRRR